MITLSPGSPVGPGSGWINLRDLPQGEMSFAPPATSTWGDPETLDRRYIEHADDFGAQNLEEYAGLANEFFLRSVKERYLQKVDQSGIIRIYDPKSNTFGAYNANGTTRTFFKPTNPSYWDRQSGDSGGDDNE
jgi:pyocin large subunit-like protein